MPYTGAHPRNGRVGRELQLIVHNTVVAKIQVTTEETNRGQKSLRVAAISINVVHVDTDEAKLLVIEYRPKFGDVFVDQFLIGVNYKYPIRGGLLN